MGKSNNKTQKKGILYDKLFNIVYTYRYDMFSISFMFILIMWYMSDFFVKGHIVFSDISIPFDTDRYLEEIFGLWNGRWSTPTMLNVPRLVFVSIPYLLSAAFGMSGEVFIKTLVTSIVLISSLSMYLFTKRLVSVYTSKEFNFFKVFALMLGGLFYALNPWVIFRIQHVYLLCGYSFFPFILMFFFNLFDPKFQAQLIDNYYIFNKKLYKRNYFDAAMLSISFAFAAGGIHYFFYSVLYLPMLGTLILAKNIVLYRKYGKDKIMLFLKNFMKKIAVFMVLFGIINFYWLGMYVASIVTHTQVSQGNINVIDTLSLFSRNSTLIKVLYMISYWWPMFNIDKLPLSFYIGGGVILSFILLAMIRAFKYNIILMFSVLSIIFIVLAMGVTNVKTAPFFLFFTKLPVIGSMFRDPNKIVGILAVNFSVLLVFGVDKVFKRIKNTTIGSVMKMGVVGIVIVSFYFYTEPLRINFLDGFYYPTKKPIEYEQLTKYLKTFTKKSEKVLYMPVADEMIQSQTSVATPFWNKNNNPDGIEKATGDVHLYNSYNNTLFLYEGNTMAVQYYMAFVQHLLDRGQTLNIDTYLDTIGAGRLIFHNEYKGHEERQQFNLKVLDLQTRLHKEYENNIFTIYRTETRPDYIKAIASKIVTPYGFTHFESINRIKDFDSNLHSVLYSALDRFDISKLIDSNDYIEAGNKNDLFLSLIPDEYYIKPFDFINDGDVFLKWSKTFTKNSEWMWFLRSQGIDNFPFDMDYTYGTAVTFATNKLDVLPYNMHKIKGKLIVDFDSLLKMDKFFKPDNPEVFSVSANPQTENNYYPEVHGEVVKGKPNNIWQVAKTGLLDAKENNPYRFRIKLSGRGANKIHFKVKFFDVKMNELAVNHVVAPAEEINFNGVNFFGEFVSPKNAKFMRLDLLTLQSPSQKQFWWIHEVELLDLGKYKVKNIFKMKKKFKESTTVNLYSRVLVSKKGGNIEVRANGKTAEVSTKSENINQFKWIFLGQFDMKKGENEIEVENIEGFNAVNLFAAIPVEKEKELFFPIKKAVETAKIFAVYEAENDFDFSGNIQSQRNALSFSNGKAISLQKGSLSKEIDILKNGEYSVVLNTCSDEMIDNGMFFSVEDEEGRQIFSKNIEFKKEEKVENSSNYIVDYKNTEEFDRKLIYMKNILNNLKPIEIKGIKLPVGKYKFKIDIDSKVKSMTSADDIHKALSNEVKVDPLMESGNIISEAGSKIPPGETKFIKLSEDSFKMEYYKTFYVGWYVYASQKMEVEEENEYIVHFDARSENIKKRHIKVQYLDNRDRLIDTAYISEVLEGDKYKWNTYEQIVKAPLGTKKMLIQFLCKPDDEFDGYLEVKNYSVIPYKKMISVDNMVLYEGTNTDNFFATYYGYKSTLKNIIGDENEEKIENTFKYDDGIRYKKIDNMKYVLNIPEKFDKGEILRLAESPALLWRAKDSKGKVLKKMSVNGVTQGFIVENSGKVEIEILLRKLYYFGISMFAIGIIGIGIFIFRK